MNKTAVLLINIGSPLSPELQDVTQYLKTFLMDEDIINIPFPMRWLLVNKFIIPNRAAKSANNYKKIWIEGKGSPLTVYTQKFAQYLESELGPQYLVKIGMRYSEPSIESAIKDLSQINIDELLIIPLYPQFAQATTGSSIKEVNINTKKFLKEISTKKLLSFYKEDCFIAAQAEIIKNTTRNKNVDHYLFSFHGLPERQVKKNQGCLKTADCCEQAGACEKNCYRAHCLATAHQLATFLALEANKWSVAFQSRVGRGKWLTPATEDAIVSIARSGTKTLAVTCPSFVSDCIETLEEIAIGEKEVFMQNGGQEFIMVPCVNDHPMWVNGFAKLVRELKTAKAEL